MEWLKKLNLTPGKMLKIGGITILSVLLITVFFKLVGSSVGSLSFKNQAGPVASGIPGLNMGQKYTSTDSHATAGESSGFAAPGSTSPIISPGNGTTGSDAENFEVTQYSGLIETRDLHGTCKVVSDLKTLSYVIFENSNTTNGACSYIFKVEINKVGEVLTTIKKLEPKELTEVNYTIKTQVEDFISEIEILQNKAKSIDETLKNAVIAYDQITALATRTQDVENLARIIESKLQTIERLTQERINTNTHLDRLAKAKTQSLDRLEYTYFNISVTENKFIDGENLKSSWKTAVKEFVRDVNQIIQDISINLVALLLLVIQYLVYLFILLVIVKYAWKLGKYIWQK